MAQIPRLFVDPALGPGQSIALEGPQAHYLANVLRLQPGAIVHLCDDRSGEWEATVLAASRRAVELAVRCQLRPREAVPDLWLCAAPLKRQRFEWVIEKATELGVRAIVPVRTRRTLAERLNDERLRAHMVEAAEQCGRTALPLLDALRPLPAVLASWPADRQLLFADEEGGAPIAPESVRLPAAILIGPEGGFDPEERRLLLAHPAAVRIGLGPRILRADTAAVAAIAQFQLAQLLSSR
jgi:16S rRNA (uracil1498-N3)-methyltransferase